MSKQAKDIKLKLYLEGIEIPISNVQLTEKKGVSPRCVVQIPVDNRALDIEPRTTVHIFYKDSMTDQKWLLIFEGEISGVDVSRNFGSRVVLLNCVHVSNHWNFAIKDPNIFNHWKGEITSQVNVSFSSQMSDDLVSEAVQKNRELAEEIDSKTLSPDLEDNLGAIRRQKSIEDLGEQTINLLTSGFDFLNLKTAIAILMKENENKVDLFLKKLANSFAETNPGYTTFHAAYQLSSRIFSFYNSKLETAVDFVQTLMKQELENQGSSFTLIDMMFKALDIINYRILVPSAPTFDEATKIPQSFLALPTPTLFSPIACNTIFKDETSNASFTKNLLGEPTRLGSYVYPAAFRANLVKSTQKVLVAPAGQLFFNPKPATAESSEGKVNPIDLQLTKKERFRGVNGHMISSDYASLRALEAAAGDSDDTTSLRARHIDMLYQSKVLSTRTFMLTTSYNPYRLVGLPGIYIDDVLPCVVGIISNIVTKLSATGESTSQINFAFPKSIRPEEKIEELEGLNILIDYWRRAGLPESLVYLSDPEERNAKRARYYPFFDDNYTGTKAQNLKWLRYLRQTLNNPEDFVFLSSWYDTDSYFPNVIGKQVYKNIMYGLEPDKNFYLLSDRNRFKIWNDSLDGSLGRYQDESADLAFQTTLKDNTENTEWIAHFIRRLQEEYSFFSKEDKLKFINRFTRRRIINEEQFWKFLIGLPENEKIENIDDIKINEDDSLGIGIRTINSSIGEERDRLIDLIKYNRKESGSSASAPFIQERRAIIKELKKSLLKNGNFIGNS